MTLASEAAFDAICFERQSLPSAEEIRMVRAITRTAVREAARLGSYRAFFHGFKIYARRLPVPSGVCVSIGVAFGVTWRMQDMTLSLVSLNDCYVLPAPISNEYILEQAQEPIACAQVR